MHKRQKSQYFQKDFLNGDWIDELLELATMLNQSGASNHEHSEVATSNDSLTYKG